MKFDAEKDFLDALRAAVLNGLCDKRFEVPSIFAMLE
jgi:hypothetical protein